MLLISKYWHFILKWFFFTTEFHPFNFNFFCYTTVIHLWNGDLIEYIETVLNQPVIFSLINRLFINPLL